SAYLLQVGEKALMWITLRARGRAGHGSRVHPDNAVTRLARADEALGCRARPVELSDAARGLLHGGRGQCGSVVGDPDDLAGQAGPAEAFLGSTWRTTANPTGLEAGYKHNVIPDAASATVDVRVLPGMEDRVLAEIQQIIGDDIEIEMFHRDIGLEVPFEGELV